MKLWILGILLPSAAALFFPTSGGGGGCCCGCGTPQPASCGCGPVCPPPQPCPSCPAPPPCPPPPTAICPQVQPVYIPSPCQGSSCGGYGGGYGGGCSGGGCGGGGGGCGGGGCGGGGGCSGGGCGGGGGGGYATNGGGGGGGYVASGGGGGYAQSAPSSGYAGSSGPTYSAPVAVAPAAEPTYNAGGGGGGGTGYQQNVEAAALQADDPNASAPAPTATSAAQAPAPSLTQAFRAPQICEPQRVKYVVLRAKKLNGSPIDEIEEEVEEVERPTSLEATASPLDNKDLTQEEILRGEEGLNDADGAAQARGATTLTDAKCNSKALRDLVLENIAKDDSLASKRQIHDASMRKFPDHTVDVICSTTGFTYLVSTTEHCEAQRDNVICFVYKRPI